MPARILVISPHPDDEAIGCGGVLRKHVVEGDHVKVLFLTSGEQGGHGHPQEETLRTREREAKQAAAVLGISEIEFWREPDGALCANWQLRERLVGSIQSYRPQIIYVPNEVDAHPDHRAAARLVRAALKSGRMNPMVLMFEVWTPLATMDEIVDITAYIEIKLAAIRAYQSQCSVMRFDEAFRGLARYRGEMHCWPGGEYAEVFSRLRL